MRHPARIAALLVLLLSAALLLGAADVASQYPGEWSSSYGAPIDPDKVKVEAFQPHLTITFDGTPEPALHNQESRWAMLIDVIGANNQLGWRLAVLDTNGSVIDSHYVTATGVVQFDSIALQTYFAYGNRVVHLWLSPPLAGPTPIPPPAVYVTNPRVLVNVYNGGC